MAARKQLWHPDEVQRFYVYAIVSPAGVPLYVGKGSGRRSAQSAKKHGGSAVILERFAREKDAYKAERRYIAELKPEANICPGGNGSRATKVRAVVCATYREIQRVGSRVYAARFLLTKLNEANAAAFGVSKLDLDRCREMARG
jgi:hypothetical protein